MSPRSPLSAETERYTPDSIWHDKVVVQIVVCDRCIFVKACVGLSGQYSQIDQNKT